MSFIRQKGNAYYLVENKREAGKVRQKVLCYLGKHSTPEAALASWQHYSNYYEGLKEFYRNDPESLKYSDPEREKARQKIEQLQAIIARHYGPTN